MSHIWKIECDGSLATMAEGRADTLDEAKVAAEAKAAEILDESHYSLYVEHVESGDYWDRYWEPESQWDYTKFPLSCEEGKTNPALWSESQHEG